MEHTEVKPEQKEAFLADLLDAMVNSMASHKQELELYQASVKAHAEQFDRAFTTAETHAEAIKVLRVDQERLADLVNTQSKLVTALQSTMLKVLDRLGVEIPTSTVNLLDGLGGCGSPSLRSRAFFISKSLISVINLGNFLGSCSSAARRASSIQRSVSSFMWREMITQPVKVSGRYENKMTPSTDCSSG
jgi:hypothetical protein